MEEKYWFRRKKYGLGWVPSTWQGWAVIAAYCGVVIWYVTSLRATSQDIDAVIEIAAPILVATLALLLICWRTGEPLKWQWGRDPRLDENLSERGEGKGPSSGQPL